MNRQSGLTLGGLLFLLILAAAVALLAFKVVPTYIEYFTVRHALEDILANGTNQSADEMRSSFGKRMDVNFIEDLNGRDLEINRDNGELTLTVPISSKKPLFGGVGLCIDLNATASAPLRQ